MNNKITFEELVLESGSHEKAEEGMCVMEAVAYFANEPHSDKPQCACPVLTSFMITLNDNTTGAERELLKPYIMRLIGTRDGNSQKRMEVLARHAVVTFAPYALRLAGLEEQAVSLEKFKSHKNIDWNAAARSAARSADYAAACSTAASACSTARSAARLEYFKIVLTVLDEALAVKNDN